MTRPISQIVLFLILNLIFFSARGEDKIGASVGKKIFRLETNINKERLSEGERLIYEVRLLSETPEIAGVSILRNPDFSNLPFERVAPDSHIGEEVRDGKRYYSVVIDRLFIGADNTGKKALKGGEYEIAISEPKIVNHPFFGRVRVDDTNIVTLKAPDRKLTISSLPADGRPEDYSGAVGNFEIEIELPKGEILAGEENVLIIRISGSGDLSNVPAPDIRQAFREGLHFRNMTDEKDFFIRKGELESEMELECRFTADEAGKFQILPIRFSYFSPEKRKYITIETQVMEIDVLPKEDTSVKPPVYHNI